MDTLQYGIEISYEDVYNTVLNLVINGYPSILSYGLKQVVSQLTDKF